MGKARKGRTRKNGGGAEKGKKEGREPSPSPQFPPAFFCVCSRFFNSAGPTISEPGTDYALNDSTRLTR